MITRSQALDQLAEHHKHIQDQLIDLMITPTEARFMRSQLMNLVLQAAIKRN